MIVHQGGDVLVTYLLTTNLISLPGQNRPWPTYLNTMPDSPDEVINVNDTAGRMDGRLMRSGEVVEHPGVQILVRAKTYRKATTIGHKLNNAIQQIARAIVTLKDENNQNKQYIIHAVKRETPILSAGKEEGGSRELASINFTITYGEYP